MRGVLVLTGYLSAIVFVIYKINTTRKLKIEIYDTREPELTYYDNIDYDAEYEEYEKQINKELDEEDIDFLFVNTNY